MAGLKRLDPRLRRIRRIGRHYLGMLGVTIPVGFELMGPTLRGARNYRRWRGFYDWDRQAIAVAPKLVHWGALPLRTTIAHESYHAYQHEHCGGKFREFDAERWAKAVVRKKCSFPPRDRHRKGEQQPVHAPAGLPQGAAGL